MATRELKDSTSLATETDYGVAKLAPDGDATAGLVVQGDDARLTAADDLATHIAEGSAAHAASAIGFTPAGAIAATDVQAALAELDTEKSGTGHTHSYQPLDGDLTAIAGLTATTDNFMQAKSSAWASRTPTQVTADLIVMVGDSGSGGTKGLVPAPASGDAAAGKYLKADGTFAVPPGSGGTGDVVGPSSSVASELALFDGTTGKLLKSATLTGLVKATAGVASAATANTDYATPNQDTTGKSAKTDALNSASTVVNVAAATAPSAGQVLRATDSTHATWQSDYYMLFFVLDGGGAVIGTGVSADLIALQAGTIVEATFLVTTPTSGGSIVIDFFKSTYADFDAGTTHPVSGDKITSSTPLTLSSATKGRDTTLTSWTTTVAQGDVIRVSVTSCSAITKGSGYLLVKKS